jgi:hypothetical protein
MAAHVLPQKKTSSRRRVKLNEHLPVDHRLSLVYRIGAALMGLFLIVFGILGVIDRIGFFNTEGDTVIGLNTNGALSVLSICVGVLLLVGMVIGGNFASTLNMVLGIAFIVSGFINLALLDTDFNPLAFHIQNVLFSFVVGILLMFFGMYGRVSSTLPHDNPYWKARHPDEAGAEERAAHRRAGHEAAAVRSGPAEEPRPGAPGTTPPAGDTERPA